MATLEDIGVSAALVNILGAFAFLLAFALLRTQPINDRVYFPKWYILGKRTSPRTRFGVVGKFVNLDIMTYFTFLNWMPEALRMSESEIISHAGLDSAVFLRIYTLGLKIFGPIAVAALLLLIPVNVSGGTLFFLCRDLVISDIDKLSISNIRPKSYKFFIHISMEYVFTFWVCYMLYNEYGRVASMRLNFLAAQGRKPEQFTLTLERQKVLKDSNSVTPSAFVSFNSRWGAAVCAQTQQSKNPILWLTNWAPEPRDVYWKNLAISFFSLSIRKLVISISLFALVFFYMIPIAFVQSLANLEGLERVAPFLRPVVEWSFLKSFMQGFVPGLVLKIFLYYLPAILMVMSKIEGHVALSVLQRRTAAKYYYFMLVNVFLGSIVAGTAFQQLHAFLHQSATQIPRNIGVSIPMKATFFITYIMLDGWAGIAFEILRLKDLVIFHLKNMFIVKTERDLEKAMDPGGLDLPEALPSLQLYFLLAIVYMVVTPILLPFILIFFAFAYFVYRHQVINMYEQQYESAAAFWPHVHARITASLLISQLLLLGLLSTKKAANSTPLLVVLPILTLTFHKYCKNRFEPAFRRYPLEEAMNKDTQDHASDSDVKLKSLLADAYLHPIFHSFEEVDLVEVKVEKNPEDIASFSPSSLCSSPSPQHAHHLEDETSDNAQRYEVEPPHSNYHYKVESPNNMSRYKNQVIKSMSFVVSKVSQPAVHPAQLLNRF
ncbi:hyperosmolality-gated Ca2+ permeable channel 1.8-like isoform X4 [Primulina tabacum]|uniref:hyperosmolality-gated Ca2+ permeable channel 1.8-like isoform X4 n=1 Tax=Primulina tabacum TaxID=48773 RepID=UPI003F5AA42C